jgi:hypothetical protein
LPDEQLVALNEALDRFAKLEPQQASRVNFIEERRAQNLDLLEAPPTGPALSTPLSAGLEAAALRQA